jgi:hypothetical protein
LQRSVPLLPLSWLLPLKRLPKRLLLQRLRLRAKRLPQRKLKLKANGERLMANEENALERAHFFAFFFFLSTFD